MGILVLSVSPAQVAAQESALTRELTTMRDLRANDDLLDASDHAVGDGLRAALDASDDTFQRDVALWEMADVHLSAAGRWPASAKNNYARRAIDAWTRYVEFAIDHKRTARIHQAVEYLQRSYLQNMAYLEMFAALTAIPGEYVNDKVVIRWVDRLRTCPGFSPPKPQPWPENICTVPACQVAVSDFRYFMRQWLDSFNLRASERARFARHVTDIPSSCM